MKKIHITKGTVAGGKSYKAGKTVEVSDAEAHFLCNIGKAEPADNKKAVDEKIKGESLTRKVNKKKVSKKDGAD